MAVGLHIPTLIVFLFLTSTLISCLKAEDGFREWCLRFEKVYWTEMERAERNKIFLDNVKLVDDLNKQHWDSEVTFAVNQFADLTQEEFKSTILMSPRSPPQFPRDRYSSSLSFNLPAAFDWREKMAVTDIKDQGSVGSCWAFSTVGNIEGQWALSTNNLTSLSAELLVDCDSTIDPKNNNADCGVFGGWPYLAFQYIERVGGIEAEASYPYCSGFGKCFPCMAPGYNKTRCGPPVPSTSCQNAESCHSKMSTAKFVPGLKVKDWVAIEKNETVIAAELVSRGPLSVAINAETLQFYHGGVWDTILHCDPTSLDHAVLLVGYGTSKNIFGSKPYWIVKNSWGKKWGENGYFRMIRGKGKCGVDQQVTCAVLEEKLNLVLNY